MRAVVSPGQASSRRRAAPRDPSRRRSLPHNATRGAPCYSATAALRFLQAVLSTPRASADILGGGVSRLKPLGLSPRVFAQQYATEFGEVVGIGIIVEDANNGFPVDRLEAEHARFAVVRGLESFSGADEFGGAESLCAMFAAYWCDRGLCEETQPGRFRLTEEGWGVAAGLFESETEERAA